ncbi:cyclophilin-like protein, partial [Ascodesmis nigricans]
MAQIYTLEPQTNAKVILHTTQGPLELELWGNECPLTVKNFLQLSLDSYYDSTIFHRLVPGFILQGGDPTGTGHGGDSIYPGGTFADEFHPRLKFNRRGLLGMANGGTKNDNGSQFFLTLAEARGLDGRNTLFGKVTGETVYNLVRWGEAELEEGVDVKEGGRPVFPVKIERVEVVVNPWPEEVKRTVRKAEVQAGEKKEKRRLEELKRKKQKKGKMMLSFAAEEGEEDGMTLPVKKKPKFDTRLVVDAPRPKSPSPPPLLPAAQESTSKSPPPQPEREPTPPPPSKKSKSRLPPSPPPPPANSLAAIQAEITALKSTFSRRTPSPPPPSTTTTKPKKSLLELQRSMLPSTSTIGGRKKKKSRDPDAADASDLALSRFRAKLQAATRYDDVDKPPTTTTEPAAVEDAGNAGNTVLEQEEEEPRECDLHFIPNCLSCHAWDKETAENVDEDTGGDVEEGLWNHRLTFEKDR